MILVETSALVAILFQEEEAVPLSETIIECEPVWIGAPTLFEFLMVASGDRSRRVQNEAMDKARKLLASIDHEIVPFTEAHAELAHAAFLRFGKGSGHPAKLNFGDCMSYALARALDVPLLYKGQDFAMTDIRAAI